MNLDLDLNKAVGRVVNPRRVRLAFLAQVKVRAVQALEAGAVDGSLACITNSAEVARGEVDVDVGRGVCIREDEREVL